MIDPRHRERIAHRLTELGDQIHAIEADAAARGFACAPEGHVTDAMPNPVLARVLSPLRAEERKAQASMHRLARREADCCIHCGCDISQADLEANPYAVSCRGCATDYPESLAGQMQMQHHDLSAMLLELLELVSQIRWRHASGQEAEIEAGACAVLLAHLERTLMRHFAAEERGGYLQDVLDAAPWLQRRVELLEGEHGALAAVLHRLCERVAGDAMPPDWSRVQADLQRFATHLLEHENVENRMMQQALLDDLGGG